MPELEIDKTSTALIVIDLQKGIGAQPTKPYPAQDVIRNAAKLVTVFRKNGMPVFLVHVLIAQETMLKVKSDLSFPRSGPLPPDWSEFVPEIAPVPYDIVIAKKQWGAFYGTDLELQLRRRGINTIILCGIFTDFAVESTARFAYEYGFQQVFAEDVLDVS
jgi:nicotinamidase-related amidase